jgi:uncharacterized membrane protein
MKFMKVAIPLAIVVMCILGIVDASFVTYEKLSGNIPPCLPGFRCATVLESPWTSVGPIPLPAFGLVFYSMLMALAVSLVLEKTSLTVAGKTIPVARAVQWLGLFGLAFAAYLMLIMGVVLHAWCVYCLLSAANCTVLFVLSRFITSSAPVGAKE